MQRTSLGGALIKTATHPKMVGVEILKLPCSGIRGNMRLNSEEVCDISLHKTQINLHNQNETVNSTITMTIRASSSSEVVLELGCAAVASSHNEKLGAVLGNTLNKCGQTCIWISGTHYS